jgi:4a-hydroxytetrahydrobiopterin dehydratase
MTNIKILSEREIKEDLKQLPGWEFKDDKISKEYKFKDFMDAFEFVHDLAPFFEKMDHHPDMQIKYNKILFELQRFDIGGKVTDKDIAVAHEIEKRYSAR